MFLKIRKILKGEEGGPNLESMIGIGVSLGIIVGLYAFSSVVYKFIYKISSFVSKYEL